MEISGVEVYSVNSDSWITIEPGFKSGEFWDNCSVIVNGNSYWAAIVDGNESAKNRSDKVLLCFDVTKLVFRIVPLSSLDLEDEVEYVDWNGTLGALVWNIESGTVAHLDVWVFDDGEQFWRKNHTFVPIEEYADRFLLLLKNGEILGCALIAYCVCLNHETGCVEDLFYAAKQSWTDEIYGYTESLAYIEGMEKLNVDNGSWFTCNKKQGLVFRRRLCAPSLMR